MAANSVCIHSASKKAGTAEAEVTESRRVGFGVADNHMVVQLDVEGSRRLAKQAGELPVLARWGRITRRVIVNADNGGGPMLDCGSEHLSRMRQGCGRRARRELDQLPEPVLPIKAQDPELFDLQAPDIGGHVSRNRGGAVEHRRLPGWRFDHPPRDFDERRQLPGLGPPDALQPPEVLWLPTGESGDGPSREISCDASPRTE